MALATFLGGPYTQTYNGVALGTVGPNTGVSVTSDGASITQDSMVESVSPSDVYGDSIIETFYRGGNVFLVTESLTHTAGSITPFWPYSTLGLMGIVGRRGSDIAAAHVLTAIAGPPATPPTTLTGGKAILAPNSNLQILFTSKMRKIPLRLQFLPYDTTGSGQSTVGWFTTT